MTDFPIMKLKAAVVFPANAYGGTGITVNYLNGAYVINLDYSKFAFTPLPPDVTPFYFLLWNNVSGVYQLASFSSSPFAPLNNPIFTGDPQAPTAAPGDNDNSLANTAFVTAAINVNNGIYRAVTTSGPVVIATNDRVVAIYKTTGAPTAVTAAAGLDQKRPGADKRFQARRRHQQHHDHADLARSYSGLGDANAGGERRIGSTVPHPRRWIFAMMKKWLLSAAILFAASPALAQTAGEVANHAIPIGRGPGVVGWGTAIPGASGQVLTSTGASGDPVFQSLTFATAAQYLAGVIATVPIAPSVIYQAETVTAYGATTTFDFSTFINTNVTLTGNITTMAVANVMAGKAGTVTFTQSGAGSFTTVWNAIFGFPGGAPPALTTGSATAVDVLSYSCRSATSCPATLLKDVR